QFYMPCMSRAIAYDRAVGFFNSTIYAIAWHAVKAFVERGGKMRIICSPILTNDDQQALHQGYSERLAESTGEHLKQQIQRLFSNPNTFKPSAVLATLVSLGIIDFKIAFLDPRQGRHERLFHDKLGIFTDDEGNKVAFKGSMNETWSGLSNDGNLESVDVFCSWTEDAGRLKSETEYFEKLWANDFPGADVREFPEIALEELRRASQPEHWPELLDEICKEIEIAERITADRMPGGRKPRGHQIEAIENWKAKNRRGVFEHATGSGKTFTALCAIRESLEQGETALILVPSELLLLQWQKEIVETLGDLRPQLLLCGAGNSEWRKDRLVGPWTRSTKTDRPRIILATMQTASKADFIESVRVGEHLFMVADEVHRMGSPENRRIFAIDAGPRLGLSATPRRFGDPDGTTAIFGYFGDVVPPVVTLQDAINSGALTPYFYTVHTVMLTVEEQEEWDAISKEIRNLYARTSGGSTGGPGPLERIKQLSIRRAHIVKACSGKLQLALSVLREHYERGQRWILYCDSQEQLQDVLRLLHGANIDATEYHTQMTGDPRETLRFFAANGGVIVSIKCLDEGIDIPSVTHALVLASSQNPREFIQRRGRVLRRSPNKLIANLHDAIVLPQQFSPDGTGILETELARAIQFGKGGLNPESVTQLQLIANRFGLDYAQLAEEGEEDD
ncbi:MAG: DEAD/DEAH box helicase family protein, partial [Candidatus Obscuribacterales bacterium]|nr:DEAD/DEAH box helicase family protein [Candidatus Obscuribacterales bacterium]